MISIILPCYNEQDNLAFLFNTLDPVANNENVLEIILVNNGSTDNSSAVFEQELTKRNCSIFKVVTVEKNIGYGYGILTGLRIAKGNILSITHADRQTDPMDVLKAFEIYQKNFQINREFDSESEPMIEVLQDSIHQEGNNFLLVKGYRKNRRPMEAFFSWGMGVLSSFALGTRLTEINAQPKLFSKSFFDHIEKDAPHDFSLDLYFLYYAKKKGRIIDFPVYFAKRVAGEAKGGSGSSWKVRWKLMRRIFKYIFELRAKVRG